MSFISETCACKRQNNHNIKTEYKENLIVARWTGVGYNYIQNKNTRIKRIQDLKHIEG